MGCMFFEAVKSACKLFLVVKVDVAPQFISDFKSWVISLYLRKKTAGSYLLFNFLCTNSHKLIRLLACLQIWNSLLGQKIHIKFLFNNFQQIL